MTNKNVRDQETIIPDISKREDWARRENAIFNAEDAFTNETEVPNWVYIMWASIGIFCAISGAYLLTH